VAVLGVTQGDGLRRSRPLTIVIVQSILDVVEPGSIPLQPVRRHGLEDRGPEPEMGGAIGFPFDRRQAGFAGQGSRREDLGYLAQSQRDAGGLPFPPPFWELIAFEADQHHAEGAGVTVAVEVNTSAAIAEQRPVPEPVCSAINNPEAQVFEETERLLYLRRPPVDPWQLTHPPIKALTLIAACPVVQEACVSTLMDCWLTLLTVIIRACSCGVPAVAAMRKKGRWLMSDASASLSAGAATAMSVLAGVSHGAALAAAVVSAIVMTVIST